MRMIKYNYHDDKSADDVLYENEFSVGYAVLTQKGHRVPDLQVVLLVSQREQLLGEMS